MFLTLLHCSKEPEVVGKIVNLGDDYGLKIPFRQHFVDPNKTIDWLKKKLETVEKELEYNVSKCLK